MTELSLCTLQRVIGLPGADYVLTPVRVAVDDSAPDHVSPVGALTSVVGQTCEQRGGVCICGEGLKTDRVALEVFVLGNVFTFVLGNALGEAATVSLSRRLSRGGANAEKQFRETMTKASEIGMQFPRLRVRLEAGVDAGYATAPDESFEFGLETIFDGMENQLAARHRG